MKNPNQVDNNQETIQLAEFYKSFIREKAHSKEYADLMNPIIQKIDEEHVKYINNSILLWNDYVGGSEALVELLANILDLGEHSVTSHYKNDKSPAIAKYSCADKAVRIAFYDGPTSEAPSNQSANKVVELCRIVAHEMWHGYQYREIEKHGPRAPIYQDNFENYIRAKEDSFQENCAYLKQPVEAEAFVFGDKFAFKFVEKIISSLEKEQSEYRGKKAMHAVSDEKSEEEGDYDVFIGDTIYLSDEDMKAAELTALKKIYNNLGMRVGWKE